MKARNPGQRDQRARRPYLVRIDRTSSGHLVYLLEWRRNRGRYVDVASAGGAPDDFAGMIARFRVRCAELGA